MVSDFRYPVARVRHGSSAQKKGGGGGAKAKHKIITKQGCLNNSEQKTQHFIPHHLIASSPDTLQRTLAAFKRASSQIHYPSDKVNPKVSPFFFSDGALAASKLGVGIERDARLSTSR